MARVCLCGPPSSIRTSTRIPRVDEEGNILRKDHVGATLAAMSLTTGGAAAAGAVLGGGVGAVVGAGVGAGVSTAWWLKQDRQTHLPKESLIVLELSEPLMIRSLVREPEFSAMPPQRESMQAPVAVGADVCRSAELCTYELSSITVQVRGRAWIPYRLPCRSAQVRAPACCSRPESLPPIARLMTPAADDYQHFARIPRIACKQEARTGLNQRRIDSKTIADRRALARLRSGSRTFFSASFAVAERRSISASGTPRLSMAIRS